MLQTLEVASLRIRSCYLKSPTKKYNNLPCPDELLSRSESKNIYFVRKKYTAVIKPEKDRNTSVKCFTEYKAGLVWMGGSKAG